MITDEQLLAVDPNLSDPELFLSKEALADPLASFEKLEDGHARALVSLQACFWMIYAERAAMRDLLAAVPEGSEAARIVNERGHALESFSKLLPEYVARRLHNIYDGQTEGSEEFFKNLNSLVFDGRLSDDEEEKLGAD